jgi:hypothetical protein
LETNGDLAGALRDRDFLLWRAGWISEPDGAEDVLMEDEDLESEDEIGPIVSAPRTANVFNDVFATPPSASAPAAQPDSSPLSSLPDTVPSTDEPISSPSRKGKERAVLRLRPAPVVPSQPAPIAAPAAPRTVLEPVVEALPEYICVPDSEEERLRAEEAVPQALGSVPMDDRSLLDKPLITVICFTVCIDLTLISTFR